MDTELLPEEIRKNLPRVEDMSPDRLVGAGIDGA